jgi:hypothetical protein
VLRFWCTVRSRSINMCLVFISICV